MLKDCHLLIVYVLLALGLSQAAYLPDYEYIQDVGWLRLHIAPATWPGAQLRCHLEDATLTAPTTSAIAAVMKTMMHAHRLNESSVFTDIYASNPKGDFTSVNGLPMSSITLQWAVGEPNNLGNEEDCLVMTGAGELADVSCSSVHPFFCLKRNATSNREECNTRYIANECNNSREVNQSNTTYNENEYNCTIEENQCNTTQEVNQSNTAHNKNECNCTIEANQCNITREANQCNTTYNENECNCTIEANQCNTTQKANQSNTTNNENECNCTIEANQCNMLCETQGYTFEPRTGSCYKFHRTAVPWYRADMKCASERAHLAIINSEQEFEVLKELFVQTSDMDDHFSIGYVKRGQTKWLTVLGETLDEAGYYKWTGGHATGWSYTDICGVTSRSGNLDERDCTSANFAYICEISPNL